MICFTCYLPLIMCWSTEKNYLHLVPCPIQQKRSHVLKQCQNLLEARVTQNNRHGVLWVLILILLQHLALLIMRPFGSFSSSVISRPLSLIFGLLLFHLTVNYKFSPKGYVPWPAALFILYALSGDFVQPPLRWAMCPVQISLFSQDLFINQYSKAQYSQLKIHYFAPETCFSYKPSFCKYIPTTTLSRKPEIEASSLTLPSSPSYQS